tara:strand:- start:1023 stop:1988 length:966 start_codon:yes stop_codon:yes gene_type:complete
MAQHFLLSAKARTLSVVQIARMTEDEARDLFRAIRWADTDGDPVCPRCGCYAVYEYKARRIFKCQGCSHQFSITSGTLFASRKLPVRDILLAMALFSNAAKGMSALQLGRDLDVQYKTAYVLAHKIREALAADQADATLKGTVEVDGAYFGGHVRPENRKEDRKDRRFKQNQSGKRRVVVVMRQRGGRTLPFVFPTEAASLNTIRERVEPGSVIHADEAASWDGLHGYYEARRVNHSVAFLDDGACTNQAESYFSRLRRAEFGQHHRISGKYLHQYAGEMAWREDNRRQPNGTLFTAMVAAAMAHPVSRQWKGYWQRSVSN